MSHFIHNILVELLQFVAAHRIPFMSRIFATKWFLPLYLRSYSTLAHANEFADLMGLFGSDVFVVR